MADSVYDEWLKARPSLFSALCCVMAPLTSDPSPPPVPPVPPRAEQPHGEVGGCVAGAGLSGPQRLLRRQGGERTLPQVSAVGKEH